MKIYTEKPKPCSVKHREVDMTKTQEREEMKREIKNHILHERRRLREENMLLKTTRAGKLLLKGKPFIVVACDEPYYLETYRTIRAHERRKGTWTAKCENDFKDAVYRWMDDSSV